jgi:hypothetical protein
MKRPVVFVAAILLGLCPARAQVFAPRSDHAARLEPSGNVVNGAGQSADAFLNYWNVMKANQKPAVSMHYVSLKGIQKNWSKQIGLRLLRYDRFVIPQIGLALTVDGSPSQHYEAEVATGLLDAEIATFLDGLQELAMPAYVRIGFEFNGLSWNGYQPQSYRLAFQRIADRIRERDLEIATVWDCAVGGTNNFAEFYPGDSYVDWFGVNVFSVEHLTHPDAYAFLDLAAAHGKPVMIGESTPRYVGVLKGETSWNSWFVPYFNLIRAHAVIKMFCYINWNWAQYAQWSDWGDCRLEANDYVKEQFRREMDNPGYLHAGSEKDFRKRLAYSDAIPPPAVTRLTSSGGAFPETLQWDPVSDSSGLAHYVVHRDGVLAGYSLQPRFDDSNVKAGERVTYAVTAMDRAGNESAPTTVVVQLPDTVDRVSNGEFNAGSDGWVLGVFSSGAAATLDIDSTARVSGPSSAHVAVTRSSGTGWHIQLQQPVAIRRGMIYVVTYKARASAAVGISATVQSDHVPNDMYWTGSAAVTTSAQTFTATFVAGASDTTNLAFFLGNIGQAEIWIDSVSVVEARSNTLPYSFGNLGGTSDLSGGYPGSTQVGYARILPNNGSTTPAGVAIFGFRQNGVLVTEAGVPASPLVTQGRLFAEVGGRVDTGLAIANPNGQPASISYYFTSSSGATFGSGSTVVPAYAQTAVFLDQAPFNSGPSVLGTFTFSSTMPISVVALRGLNNERDEFLITTLPYTGLSAGRGESVITHIADGGGWSTQVVLVNPTDENLTGTLSFFSQGSASTPGQPFTLAVNGETSSSFQYSILPRSAARFLTSGAGTSTRAGYVRIIPSAGGKTPSGLGIFSFSSGRFTITEAGVPAIPSGVAFRLYVESAGSFGTPNSIQSGIAIANLSSSPVSAICELNTLDGSSATLTAPIAIPASGQVALFLAQVPEFAGLPATFKGVLRVSTISGAPISVVGLRSRVNEREGGGDFLITTTPSVNEDSPALSVESGFPHLADSGGYTTQIILMSGLKGQSATGIVRFLSQSGQALLLPLR